MASQLTNLYEQLDDFQEALLSGALTKTEVKAKATPFLQDVKNATGSAQRGIVAELSDVVPGILNKGHRSTYNAFIKTLFDISGDKNMKLDEPALRVNGGDPEYQAACKSRNLALTVLGKVASDILENNAEQSVKLRTRMVMAMQPKQNRKIVKRKLAERYRLKMA